MTKIFHYLTLFLLPLYLIRIPLGVGGSFNILDIFLILSLLSQIGQLKKLFSKKEFLLELRANTLALFVLLFFLMSFTVSYFFSLPSKNWLDGIGILKSFLFLPVLFSLGTFLLTKKGVLKKELLLGSFFASAVLQSFIGYFYVLWGTLTYDNRLALFYESPNQLAMILAPAIIVGIHLLVQVLPFKKLPLLSNNLQKSIVLIGTISLLFSLFQTNSQGAFLGLFVALFVYFVSSYKALFKLAPLVIFIIAVTSLIITISAPQISNSLRYSPSTHKTSLDSRITIYTVSQELIRENWLTGIGPGNFQLAYLDSQPKFKAFPQWAVPHAHNNLLHVFVEGGITTLVLFVFLLFLALLKKEQKKEVCIYFFVVTIYFIVHGVVDATIWKNDVAVVWWLSLIFSLLSKKYI